LLLLAGDASVEEEEEYSRPIEAILLLQKGAPGYVEVKEQPRRLVFVREKKATNSEA